MRKLLFAGLVLLGFSCTKENVAPTQGEVFIQVVGVSLTGVETISPIVVVR